MTAQPKPPAVHGPYIHPTAVVDETAILHETCDVGPYCVIEAHATLHANVKLKAHVYVGSHTTLHEGCVVHPYAVVGNEPQSIGYQGEPTRTIIGKNTVIREYVTINRGTVKGGGETRVGEGCFLMTSSHVAHDCHVGNFVQFANCATIGGHVEIGDYAILGGLCAIHQFVRIGAYAMISGMAGVKYDVIPYGLVSAQDTKLSGLNLIGLKRRGFSTHDIQQLRRIYHDLFENRDAPFTQRLQTIQEKNEKEHGNGVRTLLDFIEAGGDRTLCFPELT